MNEKELAIKKLLLSVLEAIFEPSDVYQGFIVKVIPKELKKEGQYKNFERTIQLNNLTRSPIELYLTCLKCLALHIDTVNIEFFQESEGAYPILQKLIEASLELGLFSIQEIDELEQRGKIEDIVANCGNSDVWTLRYPLSPVAFDVYVLNGYTIKGDLRKNGYVYQKEGRTWHKSFASQEEAIQEKERLWETAAEIKVEVTTKLERNFDFDYYVAVKPNLELNDLFQQHGYTYEAYGVKKHYVKKVPTKKFFQEREFLMLYEVPFSIKIPK
ncbi:hypothetical protein ACK4CS_12675 [Enterococcus gallinarum]|uniref:Uncharacterized protein n=1 Tax=Enterococcus gallinarum TaxID=1353 RepID=A0AAE4KYW1_ENTGA|nr:hypothetical protein [Enterococcus gallinarum]MDT2691522.1 hypothetical protein [Enterococcus gallinarum]